jgi:hypothetical protein
MNDPTATAFINKALRQLCPRLRALTHDLEDALTAWHSNGIGALCTADLDAAVEDGRTAEGVPAIKCNDVVGAMAQVEALKNALTATGVQAVIGKLCPNPLSE